MNTFPANSASRLVRTVAASLAASLGACGLSACQQQVYPATPRADPLPRANYPRIVVENALSPWLVVSEPVVKPAVNNGPLTVTIPLRLLSSTPDQYARVQYRFIFLDAAGLPLRSQTDWRFMRLEPQNQVFLQGNAIDTSAVDWRCEIQSGR